MPTLVHFGAGNIGRGFIAPLFAAGGWRVVLVDVQDDLLAALAERGSYSVHEVDVDGNREVPVTGVTGCDGRDRAAVATAVATADLVGTSVGLGALRHLGPGLAAGFSQRSSARALDILVCENGAEAPDILRQAIASHLNEADRSRLETTLGLVRTSIGRMVPPPAPGLPPLDLRVEPYAKLPVEAAAFRGPLPSLPGLVAATNFDLVLEQKLFLHNGTHACLAYSGLLRGHEDIPECMDDAGLLARVRLAAAEIIEALARRHGSTDLEAEEIRIESRAMAEDLFRRYRNTALADPLRRVARDPVRKLAAGDRLLGAARACLETGVAPAALCRHLLDACAYDITDDEPRADEFRAARAAGWRTVLARFANLDPQDPLMSQLETTARRQEAADRIRAAGLLLREDEVDHIEIADFGLGRYEELGLAIVVYVNTDRCCAKELAMLPGQICPEHRHPTVDGEPGKEETFRCRAGEVHLFLPGRDPTKSQDDERTFARAFLPADKQETVTVFRHVHLRPGEQYTLAPNTPHWFVAGSEGAVVSEFSTRSRDDADIFTDSEIQRVPDPA